MSAFGIDSPVPHFDYGRFTVPGNINMDMHFAPHMSARDLPADMHDLVRNSDVVVVETVGAIKEIELEILNGLSNAEPEAVRETDRWAENSNNPAWKRLFYTALIGSGANIVIPDMPHGHEYLAQYDKITQYITNAAVHTDFSVSSPALAQALPVKLGLRQYRDQYILENMTHDIHELVSPAQTTKVVSFYGGEHHLLANALAHSSKDDTTVSITKNTDLAPRTIYGDIYEKLLTGEPIQALDALHYNLEVNLTLADQLAGKHLENAPSKAAADAIYAKVAALSIKETRELRRQTVEHIHSEL